MKCPRAEGSAWMRIMLPKTNNHCVIPVSYDGPDYHYNGLYGSELVDLPFTPTGYEPMALLGKKWIFHALLVFGTRLYLFGNVP